MRKGSKGNTSTSLPELTVIDRRAQRETAELFQRTSLPGAWSNSAFAACYVGSLARTAYSSSPCIWVLGAGCWVLGVLLLGAGVGASSSRRTLAMILRPTLGRLQVRGPEHAPGHRSASQAEPPVCEGERVLGSSIWGADTVHVRGIRKPVGGIL